MKKYCGALLITSDEKVLMQQRDDKDGVVNPGLISFFGGCIKQQESLVEGLRRELFEELSLNIDNYKLFITKKLTKDKYGSNVEAHFFIVKGICLEDLNLLEGKSIVKVDKNLSKDKSKFTKAAGEVLEKYFQIN